MLNEKKSRPPGRERKERRKGGLGRGDGSREDSSREDSRRKRAGLGQFPQNSVSLSGSLESSTFLY